MFYPIFYWGFCLMDVAMDIFYKNYQIRQHQNEENLENEVQEAVAGTKNLMLHSVTAISQLIDAKDRYTREHSQRVAEYSRLIADYMRGDATGEELELIYRSGLLHDIGKIAVPDAVLNKPERLTDEEYEVMKNTRSGAEKSYPGWSFCRRRIWEQPTIMSGTTAAAILMACTGRNFRRWCALSAQRMHWMR